MLTLAVTYSLILNTSPGVVSVKHNPESDKLNSYEGKSNKQDKENHF